MKKAIWILVIVSLLALSAVSAQLSVQLKRTNPGIAGVKNAELIFDVVNTDFTHEIEGFLWCQSPDDAVVSSSYGAGSGSGAQYVSPKFMMDVGPSQEAMTITLDADSPGDKSAGCSIKYIPFRMTEEGVKEYLTIGEEYAETVVDADYRVEYLDKTLPFARSCVVDLSCPGGAAHCSWEDLKCPEVGIFQRFLSWLKSIFGG